MAKIERFPYRKGRLAIDPTGEFVALDYRGRRLIGEIVKVEWRDGPPSGFFAKVKHFDGTPWPLEPGVAVLEWIRQDSEVNGNPDLAIVSLGMNPPRRGGLPGPKEVRIERGYVLRETIHGNQLFRGGEYISTVTDEAHARAVVDLLEGRIEPPPSAFRGLVNPPGEVFGSDVLAIVYQHSEDDPGDVRVHTFGGKQEAKWRETARGVEIYDLPRTTGVYMSAEGERRVVMQHRRGLPLVQEF